MSYNEDAQLLLSSITELSKLSPEKGTIKWNVIIFGLMGWGKSSFLNTCLVATDSPQTIKTLPSDSAPAKDSVTKMYERYQLKGTNIWLYDTYGWEVNPKSNYSVEQFRSYLRGLAPLRTRRDAFVESDDANRDLTIDAVIFVVDAETCKVTDSSAPPQIDNYWNMNPGLKDFYEQARKRNKKITLLISKVDTLITDARNYSTLNGPAFEKLKAYLQNSLHKDDTTTVILPLISYKAEWFQAPKQIRQRNTLAEYSAISAIMHNIERPPQPPSIADELFYWTPETMAHNESPNYGKYWIGGR